MHRVLAYALPVILIAIEYGLRLALKTDTAGFVGPTLASAAAGLLIPTLSLKSKAASLPSDIQSELARLKVTVRSRFDERLASLSLLLLLVFIAAGCGHSS